MNLALIPLSDEYTWSLTLYHVLPSPFFLLKVWTKTPIGCYKLNTDGSSIGITRHVVKGGP